MSSAELSLDISRLVSRARNGEAINTASEGHALATRYPDLGMSAELIGKAIDRAASMMGVVLEPQGGEPPAALQDPPTPSAGGLCGGGSSPGLAASGGTDGATAGPAAPRHTEELPAPRPAQGDTAALARPVAAMRRAFYGS